ncbi:fibronectin type III domain-containing protein [bacterium]|nr:fibronectin type III domain-containing protein [bacterium]
MLYKTLYFPISLILMILIFTLLTVGCDKDGGVAPVEELNPPTDLTAEAISSSVIRLSWIDNSENEIGFEIEESVNNDSSFTHLMDTDTNITSMEISNLQSDLTYYFRVRSMNSMDTSDYSNTAFAATPHVPIAPENLEVVYVTESEISLCWCDVSDNEEGFEIEQSVGNNTDYQLACKTGCDTTRVILDNRSPGTMYFFRVRACLGNEFSDYSNEVVATTILAEEWRLTFGGSLDDEGRKVRQTGDGGYIIVGNTKSFGSGDSDIWLIKTDIEGNEIWNRTYGGAYLDYGCDVRCTGDGGYIIAGYTASFGEGDYDAWLIKVDGSGGEVWNQTYGGTGRDKGNGVVKSPYGGYIIVGSTRSFGVGDYDAWLIRTDIVGEKVEDRTIGEGDREEVYSIEAASDDGFDIIGSTQSHDSGVSNAWLIRIDDYGRLQWYRSYGLGAFSKGCGVNSAHNMGSIIAGYTVVENTSDYNLHFVNTDYAGNIEWEIDLGGNGADKGYSCHKTSDGGYIVIGSTESYGAGETDVWVIKTDGRGSELWNAAYGGNGKDEGLHSLPTIDGGYVITGSTESSGSGGSDVLLMKIGSNLTN